MSEGADSRRRILVACIVATCANRLDPPLWVFRQPVAQAFNAGWAGYSLLTSGIAVGTLAFLLLGGVLGDIYGRKRLLLAGLAGLTIANLLLVLSSDPAWFIFTRLVGGAAGTLIVPLSLTMLYLAFSDDLKARTRAVAIYVVITTTCLLCAGLLGQLMELLFGWRATVVPTVALGILGYRLIDRATVESKVGDRSRLDVLGHAAWALTALSAMLAVTLAQVAGDFTRALVLAAIGSVVVGVAVLVWWGNHAPSSIFTQSNLPRRALLVLIIYGVCMQIGFVGYVLPVRNVLIAVYGYSSVMGTIALAPLLVGMVLMIVLAVPRLYTLEPRLVMSVCLLTMSAVIAVTALTRAPGFYPWLAVLLATIAAANIGAVTAWTLVFFAYVPQDYIGVRTGINSSVFSAGGAIATALTSGLLVAIGMADYSLRLLAAGVPPDQLYDALGALNQVLNPALPEPDLDPALLDRLVAGYQLTFLVAFERVLLIVAAFALGGSLAAWFGLPGARVKDEG